MCYFVFVTNMHNLDFGWTSNRWGALSKLTSRIFSEEIRVMSLLQQYETHSIFLLRTLPLCFIEIYICNFSLKLRLFNLKKFCEFFSQPGLQFGWNAFWLDGKERYLVIFNCYYYIYIVDLYLRYTIAI